MLLAMRRILTLASALFALALVPSTAIAAPALSGVSSAPGGAIVVSGADLLSAPTTTALTLRTSASTVRVYRPDGPRAGSNGSAVTWTASAITIQPQAATAGTRVLSAALGSATAAASVQLPPMDVSASAGAAATQLQVDAAAGMATMSFIHVRDEQGNWHRYANPRGTAATDGQLLRWTNSEVLIADGALAGLGIDEILISTSGSHAAAALTQLLPAPGEIVVAAAPTLEITSVTSPAACTVRVEGTSIAGFDHINLDLSVLIELPGGVFQSYLRAWQPGDPANAAAGTTVDVTSGASDVVTIANPAICGKEVIITSVLVGAYGAAWYDSVLVL